MRKALLLADADSWQFLGRNLYFVFSALPVQKTFPRHWAKERVVRKILSPGRVVGMPYLSWAKGSIAAVMASKSAVRYWEVLGDRGGPTGSLEPCGKNFGWKTSGP